MNIQQIGILDFYKLLEIMSSSKISDTQKARFIEKNKTEIKQVIKNAGISGAEFYQLMKNRPIIKFRPFKNSFTKRGDKILLAKSLEIEPTFVNEYIENVTEAIQKTNDLNFLPEDKIDSVKTYIYRHGSKGQLVTFLDYELEKTSDILKTLYRTLEYNTGGVADYFVRPIHRLDNKTLVKIYNIINKHLKNTTSISDEERTKYAKWTLIKIYQIQNNNKLKNAIKIHNTIC